MQTAIHRRTAPLTSPYTERRPLPLLLDSNPPPVDRILAEDGAERDDEEDEARGDGVDGFVGEGDRGLGGGAGAEVGAGYTLTGSRSPYGAVASAVAPDRVSGGSSSGMFSSAPSGSAGSGGG